MYIYNRLKYTVIERTSSQDFQALCVTINFTRRDIIWEVIYRQQHCPEKFLN